MKTKTISWRVMLFEICDKLWKTSYGNSKIESLPDKISYRYGTLPLTELAALTTLAEINGQKTFVVILKATDEGAGSGSVI